MPRGVPKAGSRTSRGIDDKGRRITTKLNNLIEKRRKELAKAEPNKQSIEQLDIDIEQTNMERELNNQVISETS